MSTRRRAQNSLIGCIIDERYEVLQLLGEGGMGCVYRVRHRVLGRLLALKALRIELARELVTAERFVQEARAAAAISHPSIVKINDFGMLETGQPYFVMELLEGRTLSSLLAEQGTFAAAYVVVIAHKIALALDAAHAAGVIHRDLKPDNVVLSALTPHQVELKVLDFGLAMMDGSSRLTRDGVVFGTPQYMSPEQATGETLDARVDQYALGIVMYELLTGRVPFTADNYMGVLTQQLYAEPIPPSAVVPVAAECAELEGVILRCLAKSASQRFESMAELAGTLVGIAARLGISIPNDGYRPPLASVRPPVESRTRRRSSRQRFLTYAILGATAFLVALGLLYLHLVRAHLPDSPVTRGRSAIERP